MFEFICSVCDNNFDSAALLLKHYAEHSVKELTIELLKLYSTHTITNGIESEANDSGIEDLDPLNFCLVTIDNKQLPKEPKKCQFMNGGKDSFSHKGEKLLICSVCDTYFSTMLLLKKHQQQVHFLKKNCRKIPDLKPIQK